MDGKIPEILFLYNNTNLKALCNTMKCKNNNLAQFAKNLNFTIRNCSFILQLIWTERQKTAVDYLSKHLEQSGEDWWSFNAVHILLQFFSCVHIQYVKKLFKNSVVHTQKRATKTQDFPVFHRTLPTTALVCHEVDELFTLQETLWASCWWNCAKQWPLHKWTLQTRQPQTVFTP